MEKICIRFAGLDQNSGAIFIQFAKENNSATIENATIHAFFPNQYQSSDFDGLLSEMALMGHSIMAQLEHAESQKQFSSEDLDRYSSLIGSIKVLDVPQGGGSANPTGQQNQYSLDTPDNPNKQSDQIRNIVLEILSEEGLIP